MIRLCIICGKEAVADNFCKSCFLSKNKLFSIEEFNMIICTNKDSYYLGTWKDFTDIKDVIRNFVEKNIKKIGKIDRIIISFKSFKGGYKLKICCKGSLNKIRKEEEIEVYASVRKMFCDNCTKISGRYHEAKIQVRGTGAEKVMNRINKMLPKTSWIEGNKHGYDIFFVNKAEAAELAKYLRKKHDVIKTFKVVGAKKGKMLMRDVYSIK